MRVGEPAQGPDLALDARPGGGVVQLGRRREQLDRHQLAVRPPRPVHVGRSALANALEQLV